MEAMETTACPKEVNGMNQSAFGVAYSEEVYRVKIKCNLKADKLRIHPEIQAENKTWKQIEGQVTFYVRDEETDLSKESICEVKLKGK